MPCGEYKCCCGGDFLLPFLGLVCRALCDLVARRRGRLGRGLSSWSLLLIGR